MGTLCALNLANLGLECDLFERRNGLWQGASFTGEGKVHLGYVYGKASTETMTSLLESANTFAEDFEHAISQNLNWGSMVSAPFNYGIPESSMITPYEFEAHASKLGELAGAVSKSSTFNYLDDVLSLDEISRPKRLSQNRFLTPEKSVDVAQLSKLVKKAIIANSRVNVYFNSHVNHVNRRGTRIELVIDNPGNEAPIYREYAYVINCAWENSSQLDSLAFDQSLPPPNLRLRMFVHAKSSYPSQALTLTLGPYGDFVSFPDGRAYASWYPEGLLGFIESPKPPEHWSDLESPSSGTSDFLQNMMAGLGDWVTEINQLKEISVYSRIVVAKGGSDIDDPASQLHQRLGSAISTNGGWYSVRSFKFSSAPRAARLLQEELKKALT